MIAILIINTSPYFTEIFSRVTMKFCVLKQIRTITKILRPKLKTCKFKMAGGRHIVKRRFGLHLTEDCPIFAELCY